MSAPPRALEIAPGRVAGAVAVPASKSMTNRLLAIAALAEGEAVLRDPLDSDDAEAMREAVAALGAEVAVEPGCWRVAGRAGRLTAPAAPIDARLSGTTMRFVTAMATLADGPVVVTGAAPLRRRPIAPLVSALGELGGDVACADGYPPTESRGGGLRGGTTTVDVRQSSQFASAVLLVAPFAAAHVEVRLRGPAADGYIDLTVAALADAGARIAEGPPRTWQVRPGGLRAPDVRVEHDASAACHLHALAAASGGAVTVTNAAPGARQPDAGFVEVLAAMGCEVSRDGDALTVRGPDRLAAIDVDLAAMPDQVTSLAALCALAEGTSTIRGVGVARTHETDRLAALAGELGKLGVAVEEAPERLRITGGTARGPATLDTHDDHRLAMAFAALGAALPGVAIADPGCVAKTYPRFWDDIAGLGLEQREVTA